MNIVIEPYFESLPKDSVDLSNVILNEDQKNWIVHEILEGRINKPNLAKKYNLKYNRVCKMVIRRKEEHVLRRGMGRPKILDDMSIQSVEIRLVELIGEENYDEDAISEAIDGEVRRAFLETYGRRYPKRFQDLQESGFNPKLVAKSRKRYCRYFRELLERVYGW